MLGDKLGDPRRIGEESDIIGPPADAVGLIGLHRGVVE
jgi:hypothetical protein